MACKPKSECYRKLVFLIVKSRQYSRCQPINILDVSVVNTVRRPHVEKWGLHRRHRAVRIKTAIAIRRAKIAPGARMPFTRGEEVGQVKKVHQTNTINDRLFRSIRYYILVLLDEENHT